MTDAPADPPTADDPAEAIADAPDPAVPGAPATRPGPTRLQRTTALIATIGVAVAILGLLSLLRPISTPAADCGTSLAVLLDGRPNPIIDPDDPPPGVTDEDIEADRERPCRERVADAARPAVVAIAVGLGVAIVALLVEVVSRALAWRRRVRARQAPPAA